MFYLPLERLLAIATSQPWPDATGGSQTPKNPSLFSVFTPSGLVDTGLAARMVANGLCMTLRAETWSSHALGAYGQVGEARDVRVMIWMDHHDDQPGIVAVWDLTRQAPTETTPYGAMLPRPVLVIGRNVRTGEHFVLRYVPGAWLNRLQPVGSAVRRSAF